MPVINNSCVVKIRNIWWVCNNAVGGLSKKKEYYCILKNLAYKAASKSNLVQKFLH